MVVFLVMMDYFRMGMFHGTNKLYSRGVKDFNCTGIGFILVLVCMYDFVCMI